MPVNKVIYGNSTLIDLTSDTITASHLESGYTAHDSSGTLITGSLNPSGGTPSVQSKTATPYTTAQTVLPDSGYDYLTQVTVSAITYTETANQAGGVTVTIGEVAP
ncbi:MAG: hypothetical protein IJQ57_05775 [Synergistaceae bacterium]|nr:hypothetical protein [Synergistaceae bacterium]MBR0252840.1 hypothetical protein [Synergistaceae bacterium]